MRTAQAHLVIATGVVLFALQTTAVAGMINGDPTAFYSGTQEYVSTASGWTADVDYAVYAPGDYTGTHVDAADHYIYAYQIFSDCSSDETLSTFTLGLLADAEADSATEDTTYGTLGGEPMVLARFVGDPPPTSVQWVLDISWGEHSTVLLFSSPYGYVEALATLADGGEGDTEFMPTPSEVGIPEPVTVCLLAIGSIALIRRRK